jgi:DNA-binding MarR family transcriptional regulator
LPFRDPADEISILAEALRPALLRAARHLRREAQKAGVSALDAQILGVIRKRPGIGGAELADFEQITRPSMSGHLKRLEEAGWISRDPALAEDRRRVGVRLTAAGLDALAAIQQRRNDWLVAKLEALSPQDRAALAAAAGPLASLAGDR